MSAIGTMPPAVLIRVLTRTGVPPPAGARNSSTVASASTGLAAVPASKTGAGNGCPLLSWVIWSLLNVPVSLPGSSLGEAGGSACGPSESMVTVTCALTGPMLPARSNCWAV